MLAKRTPSPPPPRPPEAVPQQPEGRTLGRLIDDYFTAFGQQPASVVPRASVVGRSLVFVTAIMCFLASLALGTAWAVHRAAQSWTIDAGREVTVQVKPVDGLDAEKQLSQALQIIGNTQGVLKANVLSQEENAKILEPWLGAGLDLAELPVPRLIALELDPVVPPDLPALATVLASGVPGVTLDDHRAWQAQIRSVSGWLEMAAFLVLFLMLGATVAIIVFATRSAMAGNRDIVDVLHLVGARHSFIAHEFQRHFLILGLKGGLIGGTAAGLLFVAARTIGTRVSAPVTGERFGALVESLSIGWAGYAGIVGIVAGLALLAALSSRATVYRYLREID
jgi:cell division transport system permease protein